MNKRYVFLLAVGLAFCAFTFSVSGAGICPFIDGGGSSGDISPFPDGGWPSGDISPFPDDGSSSGEPCPFVRQIPGTTSVLNDDANLSDTAPVPTDPDNDGLYEDLNGNGECDFADVILFFNQMEWIIENEPVGAFDYNGNGQVDFCDLIMLFARV